MKRQKHNIFDWWRYYTIGRDAYTKCIEKEYANNLTSLILCGIIFSIFMVFAIVNWQYYGPVETALFISLAIVSILFSVTALHMHKKHKGGAQISSRFIFNMMLAAYAVIMLASIYIDVLLSPTAVSVVFMTLLAGGVLLLPAIAPLSILFNLGVLATYVIFSLIVITPECCWVCELAPVTFGVVVGVSFSWYVNMHKMVATYNKIELEEERDQYRTQSTIDELTKLNNRRAFMQRFERYLTGSREKDNFLCCAIIDIDYFKNYNDHYGHVAGDECLRKIGGALGAPFDVSSVYVARVGGEEFAIIWFEEKADGCKVIISQLQQRIKELNIPHEKSEVAHHVTVSIGVYVAPNGMHSDHNTIYNYADNMLYEAKESGRNRATISGKDGNRYVMEVAK